MVLRILRRTEVGGVLEVEIRRPGFVGKLETIETCVMRGQRMFPRVVLAEVVANLAYERIVVGKVFAVVDVTGDEPGELRIGRVAREHLSQQAFLLQRR